MFNKININYVFFYIVLITASIILYHFQYNSIRLPYFDGSHHFSEMINYAIRLKNDPLTTLISLWKSSPELFFSYTVMSVINTLFSYNRSTIIIVYLFLLLLLFVYTYTFTNKNLKQAAIVFSFLLTSTILLRNTGGILDNRIDIISIFLFSFSLILLLQNKFHHSLFLLLLASFFKSSMLFLAFPVMLYLLYQISADFRQNIKHNLIKTIPLFLMLYIYMDNILLKSISYNLMSTGGSSAGSSLFLYFSKFYTYIMQDLFYYAFFLVQDPFFVFSSLYLLICLFKTEERSHKKLIVMYLLLLTWSYFLLTSNPLHERVLLIWFYPVYIFGILITFRIYQKNHFNHRVILALFLIQLCLIIVNNRYSSDWDQPYFVKATQDIKNQAQELSHYLDKNTTNSNIAIFVNFLSNHGPISHNYDVYRVLLHENLIHQREILGWELATYSDDWKKEFKKHTHSKDRIILILQQKPMGIAQQNNPQIYGAEIYNSWISYQKLNPECMEKIVNDITLPHVESRSVYEFNNTKQCLERLFND